MESEGDVPVLTVFTIFSILIAGTAVTHFRMTRRQQAKTIRKLTAADIAKARSSAIESDLNEILETAITGSMWEVGTESGSRENVEKEVYRTLNERIQKGWDYSTVTENIPRITDKNLKFHWQPDGSVTAHGLVDAEISHIRGPSSHGIELYFNAGIRFRRIKKVANIVAKRASNVGDLQEFERKINENYRGEGLRITIFKKEKSLVVRVEDIFGSQKVIKSTKIF